MHQHSGMRGHRLLFSLIVLAFAILFIGGVFVASHSIEWTFVAMLAVIIAASESPHRLRDLVSIVVLMFAVACTFSPSSGPGLNATDAGAPDPGASDADAGPGPDLENADRLFDLTQLHTFDIEIAPADWEWLQANAILEQYRPATLIFEGRRYEGIGVRFKGSYNTLDSCFDSTGARICSKLSLKLKFNEYTKTTRFKGLRKLSFNSSIRDDTFMHEVISYYLFRNMGLAAPRASHALINVNGEPQGLFVMVEDIDEEFIKGHWTATTGNLYKGIWPQYADAQPYVAALETNKNTANVTRMITLTETAQQATDATFATDVTSQLDLPALARYLAVDRAVFSDDGVQVFYCADATTADCRNNNYFWYEVPSGATQLIPWDVDYTLAEINVDLGRSQWDTSPTTCTPVPYCDYMPEVGCDPLQHEEWILPPQCNQLFGLVHRATWHDYRLALRELADGPMSRANLVPLVASLRTKIRPAVAADTHGPGLVIWEDNMDWLDHVLAGQLVEIERLLAEPSP